ncbi:transposase family protein [Tolypothrix sp. VBCCA 56010]|uniref:transposase family protein n=1 Tax=Tolypothrix sp. VBCCA 56010 TaxID=3137731 RepID=UPI003D7C510E
MGGYGKLWACAKLIGRSEFLALPNGIPCPDTFRRVFERINPKVFERCFLQMCTVDS